MVEELGVLMHRPSALFEVHEFLMLHSHDTRWDVMGAEHRANLILWHLIVPGTCGGVGGPPLTRISPQLLCSDESLLSLGVAQEPELGLNHMKPVIGF
jgi:hypothetical protein